MMKVKVCKSLEFVMKQPKRSFFCWETFTMEINCSIESYYVFSVFFILIFDNQVIKFIFSFYIIIRCKLDCPMDKLSTRKTTAVLSNLKMIKGVSLLVTWKQPKILKLSKVCLTLFRAWNKSTSHSSQRSIN